MLSNDPLTTAAAPSEAPAFEAETMKSVAVEASADVIDEPDQLEVYQADPLRAEPVDLEALMPPEASAEDAPLADSPVSAPPRWSAAEEAELAKGLLTVVLS